MAAAATVEDDCKSLCDGGRSSDAGQLEMGDRVEDANGDENSNISDGITQLDAAVPLLPHMLVDDVEDNGGKNEKIPVSLEEMHDTGPPMPMEAHLSDEEGSKKLRARTTPGRNEEGDCCVPDEENRQSNQQNNDNDDISATVTPSIRPPPPSMLRCMTDDSSTSNESAPMFYPVEASLVREPPVVDAVLVASERKSGSYDEVKDWLVSHLPNLHKEDIGKYCEQLVADGFDSTDMLEHIEKDDLSFMKKAHRRCLEAKLEDDIPQPNGDMSKLDMFKFVRKVKTWRKDAKRHAAVETKSHNTSSTEKRNDQVQPSFNLIISRGKVVDFYYPQNTKKSAIVNAANEGCLLGGGGVDGAISTAGGLNLFEDRQALPEVRPGVRCPTGRAVIIGPNLYGKLHTPFVIHAVGPDFRKTGHEQGDKLLSSAYTKALECAKTAKLEAVAFSLLSAGVYRGSKSVKEVLKIGLDAILEFSPHAELKEVHMCAFTREEANDLIELANEMGLKSTFKNSLKSKASF